MSKKNINDTKVKQYSLIVYDDRDLATLLTYDVKKYAYIKHNKDYTEYKKNKKIFNYINKNIKISKSKIKIINKKYKRLKKTHYHLYINFKNNRRKKWLDTFKAFNKTYQNIFCEQCKDIDGLILYFLHKTEDNKNKYQYDIKEIKANFKIEKAEEENDKNKELFNDIVNLTKGKLTYYEFYKNSPSRIFSANSFKTVIEQLKTENQVKQINKIDSRIKPLYLCEQEQNNINDLFNKNTFDKLHRKELQQKQNIDNLNRLCKEKDIIINDNDKNKLPF